LFGKKKLESISIFQLILKRPLVIVCWYV